MRGIMDDVRAMRPDEILVLVRDDVGALRCNFEQQHAIVRVSKQLEGDF